MCAGGGGKTLALAAMMENKGQIYATDRDGRRLAPIWDRMERAGVRNVQVRAPKGPQDILGDLEGACDLVLVDAPCTGAGTWRRNPDAKWRVRPGAIEQRIVEQDACAARRGPLCEARRAHRLHHMLGSAGGERGAGGGFSGRQPGLPARRHGARGAQGGRAATCRARLNAGAGLRLSPATAGTDGFYIALLAKP